MCTVEHLPVPPPPPPPPPLGGLGTEPQLSDHGAVEGAFHSLAGAQGQQVRERTLLNIAGSLNQLGATDAARALSLELASRGLERVIREGSLINLLHIAT